MNAAETILKKSRVAVYLPVLGVMVYLRALRTRGMLEAGLLPLANYRADEVSEEEREAAERRLLETARNLLVAQAVEPRIFASDHPMVRAPGTICIDDIPDDDVLLAYKQIVRLSDTRFYGVNHAAYDPDEHAALYESQRKMAVMIYELACELHLSPLVIEGWEPDEISRVLAYRDAYIAEVERRRAAAKDGGNG